MGEAALAELCSAGPPVDTGVLNQAFWKGVSRWSEEWRVWWRGNWGSGLTGSGENEKGNPSCHLQLCNRVEKRRGTSHGCIVLTCVPLWKVNKVLVSYWRKSKWLWGVSDVERDGQKGHGLSILKAIQNSLWPWATWPALSLYFGWGLDKVISMVSSQPQ